MDESLEYRAIKKHYTELTVAITQGIVPSTLFQNDVICDNRRHYELATLPIKTEHKRDGNCDGRYTKDAPGSICQNINFQYFWWSLSEEEALKDIME